MKAVHLFFANFMIQHGSEKLKETCDLCQKDVLFMVLDSEVDKIKHI